MRGLAQSSPRNGDDGENVEAILAARVPSDHFGRVSAGLREHLQLVVKRIGAGGQPGIVRHPDIQPQSGLWACGLRLELDQRYGHPDLYFARITSGYSDASERAFRFCSNESDFAVSEKQHWDPGIQGELRRYPLSTEFPTVAESDQSHRCPLSARMRDARAGLIPRDSTRISGYAGD